MDTAPSAVSAAPSGRLLVTGATGFIGRALCMTAVRRGWTVRAAVRGGGPPAGVDGVAVGDIDAQTCWDEALHGVDTVIHLAARVHVLRDAATDPLAEFRRVNAAATGQLARAAIRHGVRRLVFVSSVKVNGEATRPGERFRESDPPAPVDAYGRSKLEAEQLLRDIAAADGLEVVIVRPPLVYGPGVRGNFARLLATVRRGVPLPLASVDNARSLVYVGNLVDALLLCAVHPAAAGQTYLVSDGEDLSTPALLRAVAMAGSVRASLWPFPPSLLLAAGSLLGRRQDLVRLLESLQVDNGKIRSELGWVPPFSVAEALQNTWEPACATSRNA